MFLDELINQNEKNKINFDMIKLLEEKQKALKKQLTENLPTLINEFYIDKFREFIDIEMISYVLQFDREKALCKYAELFNQKVEEYNQSVIDKGTTSGKTIKLLHSVRKQVKLLRCASKYLYEVFGEKFSDAGSYYQSLQDQFGEIKDLADWLKLIKIFEHDLSASKREIKEFKGRLKRQLRNLAVNIDLYPVPIHQDKFYNG